MLRNLADRRFLPVFQIVGFLWGISIIYFTSGDKLLVDNLPSSWKFSFLFKSAFVTDFFLAFVISIFAWHLLFFRTLFASDEKKPRWHMPLLRIIDYAWYCGSAYAALLVVAAFQSQFSLTMLERSTEQEAYLHGRLANQFEELATSCVDLPAPISSAASEDLINAFTLITAVCAYENAKVEKEGPFYDMTIGRDCQLIAAERRLRASFRTPPERAGYAMDLRRRDDVLTRYEHIRQLCRTQVDLTEIAAASEIAASMTNSSSWWSYNGYEPGHFRWIALLIGLRLVRTTFEVVEAVRKVRRTD